MRATVLSFVLALAVCASGQATLTDADFPGCEPGIAQCFLEASEKGLGDTTANESAQLQALCEVMKSAASCIDLCPMTKEQKVTVDNLVKRTCEADSLEEATDLLLESSNFLTVFQDTTYDSEDSESGSNEATGSESGSDLDTASENDPLDGAGSESGSDELSESESGSDSVTDLEDEPTNDANSESEADDSANSSGAMAALRNGASSTAPSCFAILGVALIFVVVF